MTPSLKIPPPSELAEFRLTVLRVRMTLSVLSSPGPWPLKMPPPFTAVFALTRLSVIVNMPRRPPERLLTPPPEAAELPVKTLSVRSNDRVLWIPPPSSEAVLPSTVLLVSVAVPSLKIPPPRSRLIADDDTAGDRDRPVVVAQARAISDYRPSSDRHAGDVHGGMGVHIEHAIDELSRSTTAHDRRGRTCANDRQIIANVEIAGRSGVFVCSGDRHGYRRQPAREWCRALGWHWRM